MQMMINMFRRVSAVVTIAVGLILAGPSAFASDTYSSDEIFRMATDFFGETTEGLASIVEKIFIDKGPYPNMRPLQRETQFVQFLEALDPDDAKLVVSIKDKKMPYKGITKGLFEEAWPALASTWVVQSNGQNNSA